MSSDFPMSIAQFSEIKSKKKNKQSRQTEHEVLKNKSKTRDTDNVIPLSRPADSFFAADVHLDPTSSQVAQQEFPMSQFDDEHSDIHSDNAGKQKRSKSKLRLSILGLTFCGLWLSIATGHLHSELSFVTHLQTQLDQFILGSENSQTTKHTPSMLEQETNARDQNLSEGSGIEGGAPVVPMATVEGTTLTSDVAQANTEQHSAVSNAEFVSTETSPLIATTAQPAMSSTELEGLVKTFIDQSQQMNAVESHLIRLLEMHSTPENVKTVIETLERRHMAAIKSLKERNKSRKLNTDAAN